MLALLSPSWAARVPIDACGVMIAAGNVGILTADLACPPDVPAVTMAAGTKLLLAEHTISGGYHGVHVLEGGRPAGAPWCEVPGCFRGAARCGLAMAHPADLRAVELRANGECGILNANNHSLKLRDVTIADNDGDGIAGNLISSGLGDGLLQANRIQILRNTDVAARLFTPGKYNIKRFVVRDNGGGVVISGPKLGVLTNGDIFTHICDLVASIPPVERGLVQIGTRCDP